MERVFFRLMVIYWLECGFHACSDRGEDRIAIRADADRVLTVTSNLRQERAMES